LRAQAGFVAGLDPDESSLREHRDPLLALSCGLAEALPYVDDTFDLICSSWVLEHLAEPQRAFVEVARALRPGGHFIFLTPNVRHPLLVLNRALSWTQGRLVDWAYGRAEEDIFPALYRANTARQIEQLARVVGMEQVSLRFVEDPTYVAFSQPLFRLACLLVRVIPRWMRVHMVGDYVTPLL
jgi:SAM-dependent methyltransferase